ncbi:MULTISPECIES: hydroxymethylbilane synthase [unclassified Chelatococcus]|uniref:hydroxymethylbilane synthase n=1 Tax=unclassified Chelatococcus TaxID=2638111 RepID=UPI001BCE5023|nr:MULTISPECIES: hydroxymethylbilane synthase [unclassified Chelatococcus]MBS7697146.1 hydroxymethylbilane synthase [Chelatococcus sp. YT9]MBX3559631.1 hydroxymethylbilane synthase [Chelatococcus sp.]
MVIGTRASPLALAQAEETRARLVAAAGLAPEALPLLPLTTTGDKIQDRALSEAGGKGLFTKELDAALFAGSADLTVHSAKDLPTELPEGLVIAGYLPREDVRDVFISRRADSLMSLPVGAVVGSASLRRQAQILRARPDLKVTLLRGNVATRLARLDEGRVDATLLALAGLKRLGKVDVATAILDTDDFLPAVGQGAIALVARAGDAAVLAAAATIADHDTGVALTAERAFLKVLDGSCRTPIAGHATVDGGRLRFRGLLLAPDGSRFVAVAREGDIREAAALGEEAGRAVIAEAGPDLLRG